MKHTPNNVAKHIVATENAVVNSESAGKTKKCDTITTINHRFFHGAKHTITNGHQDMVDALEDLIHADNPAECTVSLDIKLSNEEELGQMFVQLPEGTNIYRMTDEQYKDAFMELLERLKETKMDAETVDYLEIAIDHWLKKVNAVDNYEAYVTLDTDDFLRGRGLAKVKNKKGAYGGYRTEQREEVVNHLIILSHLAVTGKVTVYKGNKKESGVVRTSPLINIDFIDRIPKKGESGNYKIRVSFRPGNVLRALLRHNWMTAKMPTKVLNYDPVREKYEKCIAREFTHLHRNNQQKGDYAAVIPVKQILHRLGIDPETFPHKRKQELRERIEQAMNNLVNDGVFASCRYAEQYDEEGMDKPGWFKKWLDWKVLAVPPDEIIEQYGKIKNFQPKEQNAKKVNTLMQQVKEKRKQLGLNLDQAAEAIGISVASLSKYENGKQMPRGANSRKIKQWLKKIEKEAGNQ